MKFQLLNEDKGFLLDLTGKKNSLEPVLLIIVG